MSHNITLSGVTIDDLEILSDAVKIASKGRAELVKGQTKFRTYPDQPNSCLHAIKMPGRHDIGLVESEDKQGYNFVYDPYGMDSVFVGKLHGQDGQMNPHFHIGGLVQEYTLMKAEQRAAMRGMTCRRMPQKNGAVTLQVEVA